MSKLRLPVSEDHTRNPQEQCEHQTNQNVLVTFVTLSAEESEWWDEEATDIDQQVNTVDVPAVEHGKEPTENEQDEIDPEILVASIFLSVNLDRWEEDTQNGVNAVSLSFHSHFCSLFV
jgi:hypothetical protein